jgi:hypothetical protein
MDIVVPHKGDQRVGYLCETQEEYAKSMLEVLKLYQSKEGGLQLQQMQIRAKARAEVFLLFQCDSSSFFAS